VVDLAREVAGIFGIKIDELKVLSRISSCKAFKPVVICNRRVTIWIDKECIKLCEHDDTDITYIYVTKQGARDELREALDKLNYVDTQDEFIILSGITRQLRRALIYMKTSGANYYIFNEDMPW